MKCVYCVVHCRLLIRMPSLHCGDRKFTADETPSLTLNPERFSISSGLLERDP